MKITTDYTNFIQHPARAGSHEVDFGAWWSDRILPDGTRKGPYWRVSWICDTGELYAVSMGTKLVILGIYHTRDQVDRAMEGWSNYELPEYMDLRALAERLS